MGDIDVVKALFRYDAWANERSFGAVGGIPADARSEGVTRSLFELLSHVTGTADAYLDLLRASMAAEVEARRAWYRSLQDDLDRLRERSRMLSAQYAAYLASMRSDDLARRLRIPWLDTEVNVGEALLQVIVHSIAHRADISTVLTRNATKTPSLDFVFWIADRQAQDPRALSP